MKNILNEAPGQEGYAIGVKIKDSFFVTNQPLIYADYR